MSGLRSWFGAALAFIYIVAGAVVIRSELRHGGGWINLKGLGVVLVTAPSQATLGTLLERLGVRRINYGYPGPADYAQITLHLLVTAGVLYLVGCGLEWLARRALAG